MKTDKMEKIRIAKGYSYAQIAELMGMKEEQVKETLRGQADYLHLENAFALEVALTASHTPTREEVAQTVYDMLKLPDNWGVEKGLGQERYEEDVRAESGVQRADRVCEEASHQVYQIPGIVQKCQGEYTLEDYYNLPEETIRYTEMINGVIYTRSSPSKTHQIIVRELILDIGLYIRKKKGKCQLFLEPFDMIISDNTVIKPDILVICNDDQLSEDGVNGAPDFVIEVLSESTKLEDLKEKLPVYREQGVRECWMIDPKYEKVIVYRFEEKAGATIYGFDDRIPVQIYNGDLQLDFQRIREILNNGGRYV